METIDILNKVNDIFENHDCHLLGASIETMAESFGSSEYDEYYWHDICYTKHKGEAGKNCCFMGLDVTLEGKFPKIELKVQIKTHHYNSSFDNLEQYFEIQDFINECEKMINEINEELYGINISEVEND